MAEKKDTEKKVIGKDDDYWFKWDVWAKKRHELRMKKIEHNQSFSWNNFFLTVFGFFAVIIVSALICATVIVGNYTEVASATVTALGGSAIDINGEYKEEFTTVNERGLEKINLSCIDEYNYSWYPGDYSMTESLKDAGCTKYGQYPWQTTMVNYTYQNATYLIPDGAYWKCPLRNCATKEVLTKKKGTAIPQSLTIDKIGINLGRKGE